ncbi:PREDICTED: proteinase-activated receptor 2 isoform X1 [Hipposideros armiger]|uniref:Proteinase-activated receptor 2 isoform X1 n=1 Tax=Hipposideros armiger TaxID=186990 RepID=A0A8B7R638_HIPAR|nr:PREDICTED: proteinase-activated receptor 2 isoform X1 [Hipposideros armiger]
MPTPLSRIVTMVFTQLLIPRRDKRATRGFRTALRSAVGLGPKGAQPQQPPAAQLPQRGRGSPQLSRQILRGSYLHPASSRHLKTKIQTAKRRKLCPGFNRSSKGRSLIGKIDGSSQISGKVDPVFSVDELSATILTGKLTTVFLPLVYTIVFMVGLPSNVMALWVFLFRTKKKHPAVVYMGNLALADLLSIIWLPWKIAYHIHGNNWIYGEALCKVLIGFFYGNMYCSILFMTCLSVQRYWVIVNPMVHAKKNANIAVGVSLGIWLLILVVTIPLYVMKQTSHIPALNITTCHDVLPEKVLVGDMFNYFLSLAIGVFLFPAFLTASAYVLMIRTLRSSAMDENSGKKRRRAIKLIVTVLAMYLMCFTPSNLLLVVHYFLIKHQGQSYVYALYLTALCLSTLNSCIDPFVYYFVSQDFRDHAKNAILCRSVRTVKRMQISLLSKKSSRKSSSYSSSSTTVKTSY